VASAVALVLVAVFVVENTRRTKIRFIIPQVKAPLFVALFLAVLVGAGLGYQLGRSRKK
jgi:uncharacterized integral membrane protein